MYHGELEEGLVDEDERDEEGEDFLGEARDEAHEKAALEGHDDDHDDYEPKADPGAARQVLDVVSFAELSTKTVKQPNGDFFSC